MYSLLIVDDELLVQVGLKSMLDYQKLGIDLIGIAGNGAAAYEIIKEQRPSIVIADIKMPIMTGLALMKKCMEDFGQPPVFIILTSYGDFQYAKEALTSQAVDYLVKFELTPDILETALQRAISKIASLNLCQEPNLPGCSLKEYQDKCYVRLIHNLFTNEEEFKNQSRSLGLNFDSVCYCAVCFLTEYGSGGDSLSDNIKLYNNTLQMFYQVMSKYFDCQVIPVYVQRFVAIIKFNRIWDDALSGELLSVLHRTIQMIENYYQVELSAAVGRGVANPFYLSRSYSDTRNVIPYLTKEKNVIFIDELSFHRQPATIFDISLFRNDIRKAYQEYDALALSSIFQNIRTLFSQDETHFTQSIDLASSILHTTITFLSDGANIASAIFKDEPDTYQSLYRQTCTADVLLWLDKLEVGLLEHFDLCRTNRPGNYLVARIQTYITEHITEKLSLQEISDLFDINATYLSQIFKKYSNTGFNEFITETKIEKAKALLKETNLRTYEIAEQLGYENAFYFSRVFKKVTGKSPRDYKTPSNEDIFSK